MAQLADNTQIGQDLILGAVRESCRPIVVGIDFGIEYSGVAWAFKSTPEAVRFGSPTAHDPTQLRVPTTLLELADGSWEFGYAAEAKYSEVLQSAAYTGKQPTAYLYRRFKMLLKDQNNGFDTLTALSINGKSQNLMTLITKALKFLKDFSINQLSVGYGGDVMPNRDVQWVLTVPAIWNDFGKAFMRKAAFKAGLIEEEQSDNLLLVLEPEGAALAVHVGAAQHGLLRADNRFMVLDCARRTVGITAHEVTGRRPLQLSIVGTPTGGDWGGDYVNMEFKKFLAELLGPDLFREQDLPLEFGAVYRDFCKVKEVYNPDQYPPHINLVDVLDNKRQLMGLVEAHNVRHPDKIVLINPSLRCGFLMMSRELMLSFFEPFLLATVNETRRVMKETPGIRHIMVVGGFGSSKVLTTRIRAEFHNRGGVKVILPENPKPQGAIVHGAVYFGLHNDIIQSQASLRPSSSPSSDCVALLEDCQRMLERLDDARQRRSFGQRFTAMQAQLNAALVESDFRQVSSMAIALQALQSESATLLMSERDFHALANAHAQLTMRMVTKCKAVAEAQEYSDLVALSTKLEVLTAAAATSLPDEAEFDPVLVTHREGVNALLSSAQTPSAPALAASTDFNTAQTYATLCAERIRRLEQELLVARGTANHMIQRVAEFNLLVGNNHIQRDLQQTRVKSDFPAGEDFRLKFIASFLNFESFACDAVNCLEDLGIEKAEEDFVQEIMVSVFNAAVEEIARRLAEKRVILEKCFDAVLPEGGEESIVKLFWYSTQQMQMPQEVQALSDMRIWEMTKNLGGRVPVLLAEMERQAAEGCIANDENTIRINKLLGFLLELQTVAELSDPRCFLQPAPGSRVSYKEGYCMEILSPGTKKFGRIQEGRQVEVVLCGLYFEDSTNAFATVKPVVPCLVRRLIEK